MLNHLIELGKTFVENYGEIGLFFFSFTESFIQPIPVDPILAMATSMGFNPHVAFLIVLFSSLLGASFGYFLGLKLGHPFAVKIFGERQINKAEKFLYKWEFWGIIFVAFTPIPFKIAVWMAGILEMPFRKFFLASFIGRGVRFAFVSYGAYFLSLL